MLTLLLATGDSTSVHAGITADDVATVVLLGELAVGRLGDATSQRKPQAQVDIFLDIV